MKTKADAPTFDEIRAILKRVSIGHEKFQADMQEMKARHKETAALQAKRQKEVTERQKEVTERQKETDRQIKEVAKRQKEVAERQKETDKQMKETDRKMKETDKQIKAMVGDFGNRWGKLGENLVKGNLAQRLRERGVKVDKVMTNVRTKYSEFDIIAINGKEVVVVEVKATLDPSDVEEFEEDMEQFKECWPEFKSKRVYGAMAFLMKANRQADSLAQKKGFFVIEAVGDVVIQNKKSFKPQVFS